MWLFDLCGVFLTSATLIFRGTDISKCFKESPGLRDYESRLYLFSWRNKTNIYMIPLLPGCLNNILCNFNPVSEPYDREHEAV